MVETYGTDRREEISSLLDVARAISPNSEKIASTSRTSPEDTEKLALIRLLNDNRQSNKALLEILKETPTGEEIKKYLGLDKNEQAEVPIVDTSRIASSQTQRAVIFLPSENNQYRMVKLEKENQKPWELDDVNAEEGDNNIVINNPETARKLNEHIKDQEATYEANLTELAKTTF